MGEKAIEDLAKKLSPEDIKKLIKELPEEKAKEYKDFVTQKGFTKRKFLKLIGAAVAAGVGAAVLKELGLFGEKEEEITVEKKEEPEKEFDIEKASSIELFEKLAEYPEAIEKSRKQSLDKFAEDLAKKDLNNLILGENWRSSIGEKEAAYFLEQLLKNNRKISAIGFDGLSSTVLEHIKAKEEFNEGKLSPREMYELIGISLPMLELARRYSIEIVGLEPELLGDTSRIIMHKELPRFGQISKRVGEVAKEKKEKGIVVTYVFPENVTVDFWENEKLLHELAGEKIPYPPKEEVLKNKYTIKEHLEKMGLNPVAIQIQDWKALAKSVDTALYKGFSAMHPDDLKLEDIEKTKEIWRKFILREKEPFVVKYPKGEENTFAMIIPGKVPESPEFVKYFLPKN